MTKFEEMSFDELKLYRREGLWRSFGILLVVLFVILGMVIMQLHHVSRSGLHRFQTIGVMVVVSLMAYLRNIAKANQVMRQHPDWIRQSGFAAHIPLPRKWHIKRFFVFGLAMGVIMLSFAMLYKPQVHRHSNYPDQSIPSSLPSDYKASENPIEDAASLTESD